MWENRLRGIKGLCIEIVVLINHDNASYRASVRLDGSPVHAAARAEGGRRGCCWRGSRRGGKVVEEEGRELEEDTQVTTIEW